MQRTKKITFCAISIAIGLILHQFTPSIPFFGITMQCDFSLAILFSLLILVTRKDYKLSLAVGMCFGIASALTTKMPMGNIANLVDKFVTTNLIFLFISFTSNKIKDDILFLIISFIGTLISGSVFILTAITFGAFAIDMYIPLLATVVEPSMIVNTIVGFFIFKIMKKILKSFN